MKILMIVKSLHHSYMGGIQTHVWKIARQLTDRGNEVWIMVAQNIFRPAKPFIDSGIHIIPIPYISGNLRFFHFFLIDEVSFNIGVWQRIKKYLADDRGFFDVIHIQGRSGFLYPLFKKSGFPPSVVTFHGTMKNENEAALRDRTMPLKRRLELKLIQSYATKIEKMLIAKSDRLIAVSNQMATTLAQQFGLKDRKIDIVYNGLDPKEFYPSSEKQIPFRIVSVARLDPRKGLIYLIEATRQLMDEFPELTVHIVGEGSQRTVLERKINELGLQNVVTLIGSKRGEELLNEYQAAELFVLPSLGESQGIVFMEAMACGLPVVGFNIGGVDEVVRDGIDGYLAEKENVTSLINAIRRIFLNKEQGKQMGMRGRERIMRHFQWRQIALRTESIYKELISEKHKQGSLL